MISRMFKVAMRGFAKPSKSPHCLQNRIGVTMTSPIKSNRVGCSRIDALWPISELHDAFSSAQRRANGTQRAHLPTSCNRLLKARQCACSEWLQVPRSSSCSQRRFFISLRIWQTQKAPKSHSADCPSRTSNQTHPISNVLLWPISKIPAFPVSAARSSQPGW